MADEQLATAGTEGEAPQQQFAMQRSTSKTHHLSHPPPQIFFARTGTRISTSI